MRQLLSRKSNQKMSQHEPHDSKHGASSDPDDLSSIRIFPLPPIRRVEGKKLDEPISPGKVSFQSPEIKGISRLRDISDQREVSERSQYVPSKSGPPKVLTMSNASKKGLVYRRCEDEPIHAPGSIQPFGALLGLKYDGHGDLQVRIASENSRKVLGYGPEQLFALPSFLGVLNHETRQEMVAHINHLLHGADEMKEETQLAVFQMIIGFPFEPDISLWCAMHLAPCTQGLLICEFEEYSDAFYFKDVKSAKSLPLMPHIPTSADVSADDFKKSTTSASKPLPVLDIARKRGNQHFSSLDIFKAMTQAQKQIAACTSLSMVFDVVVGIVSELTGFHRVMFYRFDSEMNGCVESELLNPRASNDTFRGLYFPASDIPKQAQELYKINRIRLLHDRDAETARLVYRNKTDFAQPLDLTHAYLRSISPVHCKYLGNMGVRSTMSISIIIDSKLWGLVACHGYGDAGIRVSLPIQELCRTIGECAAASIQRLLMLQRIQARTVPMTNTSALNPATFIANSSADLLKLVDADFAVLSIDNKTRTIGMLDPYQEALAIMSYLQSCRFTTVQSSHNISADFPGLSYSPGLNLIGGLLLVPMNVKGGNHFLVFFRKTQTRHVNWAGNPYTKKSKAGSDNLDPRTSFKKWGETIAGRSREWTDDQLDTASVLSTAYSKSIDLWQEKNAANETAQMTLIRNSTNEIGNPLNSLIDYLEMASENIVDEKTRDILSKAQEASNSLVNAMDNLFKLTNAEDGFNHPKGETFDLKLTTTRVLQVLQKEAKKKAFDFTISIHEKLPAYVRGNGDRFKQLIVYFTRSAFKRSSSVKFNVFLIGTQEQNSTILLQVQDNGPGMSESELNMTIEEFENGQDNENWPVPTTDTTPSLDETEGDLSVDITVIGQYVRSLDGKIQVTSEPGTGTIFSLELAFEHPPLGKPRKLRNLFPATSRPSISPPPVPRPSISPPPASPSPPLRSPKPMHRETRRRGEQATNQAQTSWNPSHRSSSLPPPPSHKALPARPSQRDHALNVSSPLGSSPLGSSPLGSSPLGSSPLGSSPLGSSPLGSSPLGSSSLRSSSLGSSPPNTIHDDKDNETNRHSLSNLNILIADDDPISLRMLEERLSQWGHSVHTACDGLECHDKFASDVDKFDVILMDLKMPGVDGTLSTRMIRFLEKEQTQTQRYTSVSNSHESKNGKSKQRVAIFAVSASLQEDKRFDYLQSGFDGWILKPIDFRRLDIMLQGVKKEKLRKDTLYTPGHWEKGGWFLP